MGGVSQVVSLFQRELRKMLEWLGFRHEIREGQSKRRESPLPL